MVHYRRNFVAGGTYFFTATLHDRTAEWLISHVHLLREAFRLARRKRPFDVDAIVVLPDHLHYIWTLPSSDANYPHRWRLIKSRFSRSLAVAGAPVRRNTEGEYDVWQRRFWEHTVRDEGDFQTHVNYIHYNPVKHGLVKSVAEWPYSSFQRFVRLGWLTVEWAGDSSLADRTIGE